MSQEGNQTDWSKLAEEFEEEQDLIPDIDAFGTFEASCALSACEAIAEYLHWRADKDAAHLLAMVEFLVEIAEIRCAEKHKPVSQDDSWEAVVLSDEGFNSFVEKISMV